MLCGNNFNQMCIVNENHVASLQTVGRISARISEANNLFGDRVMSKRIADVLET